MTTDLLQLSVKESIDIIVEKSHEFDEMRKLMANLRESISKNLLNDLSETFRSPDVSVDSVISLLNRIKQYKTLAANASKDVKRELNFPINELLKTLFARYVGFSLKKGREVDITLNDVDSFNGDDINPYYGNSFQHSFKELELVNVDNNDLYCFISYCPYLFKKGQFELGFDSFESVILNLDDFDFVIYCHKYTKDADWAANRGFYRVIFTVPDFISIIKSITEIE